MDGLLKQITEWIGRACNFTFLNKVSRDGGSAQKFHELCDDKKPVVNVFFNKDNNVYGETWDGSINRFTDRNAFLKPYKFQTNIGTSGNHFKSTQNEVWFKNLQSNSHFFEKSCDYYKRDTVSVFDGTRFHVAGEAAESAANGHNKEFRLVNYGPSDELPDVPWREQPLWNIQTFQELKGYITKYEPLKKSNVPEANILLIGHVGAGKSSFVNTINSIFKGEISSRACTGSHASYRSLTKRFAKIRIHDAEAEELLKFRICDTPGIERDQPIQENCVLKMLGGELPNHCEMGPSFTPYGRLNQTPTLKDKIHVVVFVIDGSTLDDLPKDIVEHLNDIKTLLVDRGIPHLIFLTKMDKRFGFLEEDISNMFMIKDVEDVFNKAADIIGMPRSHVLPVKNYEKETTLHINLNILALVALRQALLFADDFLENQYEIEQENSRR